MITQDQLKHVLMYDPLTGLFTWAHSSSFFEQGAVAGYTDKRRGYVSISIHKKRYYAHRLAILYMAGYMPENSVDHIDRDRSNNRYSNLREASHQCQMRNCKPQRNNSSGVKGVSWHKRGEKWQAHINLDHKMRSLGLFADLLDAAYARLAAEQCLGFQDCDLVSSAKQFILARLGEGQIKTPRQSQPAPTGSRGVSEETEDNPRFRDHVRKR